MLAERESVVTKIDADIADAMVHIHDRDNHMVAICGAPLLGIDASRDELDCVVCAELELLGF